MIKLKEHFTIQGICLLKDDIIIAQVIPCDFDVTLFQIAIPEYLPDFTHHSMAGPFKTFEDAKLYCELMAVFLDLKKHMRKPTLLDALKRSFIPIFH